MADVEREARLRRIGRWAGGQRLAVGFSITNKATGPDDTRPKQVTTKAWPHTRPLANGDVGETVFGRGITCNPAVVLRPSGLVGLECDSEEDLAAIESLELPATITVRSSASYKRHFWFWAPAGMETLLYVAFRFEHGSVYADEHRYLLMPPAIHPTGVEYAFLPGLGPGEVEIAELPFAAYRECVRRWQAGEQERREQRRTAPAAQVNGARHDVIFRYACALRNWMTSEDEILEAALAYNQRRFADHPDGPMSEQRVRSHVRGALKIADRPPDPDELELRRQAEEFEREFLAGEVKPSPPRANNTRRPSAERQPSGPLGWDWLTAFETKRVVWLDRPFWQASAFHLKVGRKGVGKGTSLADLAARFSRGEMGEKRRVLWVGSEDSVSIDVKPRVLAAGGDPGQIAVVKDWLQLPRDVPRLKATLEAVGEVGLLVIDPVSNHIAGKNSNDETDVREAIAHLNALADEFALVAVGVRHLTEKEAKSGLLAAILGSSAWVQVPRAVIALARDPHRQDVIHMQVVAGNRTAPGAPGRRFRIEAATVETDDGPGEVSRVVWEGESTVDVEELLTVRHTPEPSRSEDARALILATLQAAPGQRMGAEEFDALIAERAGISAKTVRNLRSELGAKGRGWLKAIPVKDEFGEVVRWDVGLTDGAPQPDPGAPDPGPIHPAPGSGVFMRDSDGFGRPDPDIPGCGDEPGSGPGSGPFREPEPEPEPEPERLECPVHAGEHEVVSRAAGLAFLSCGCHVVEERP